MPNSILFSFKSKMNFKLKVKRISVYKFQDKCGTPDIPLNASIKLQEILFIIILQIIKDTKLFVKILLNVYLKEIGIKIYLFWNQLPNARPKS